ncbi:CYTH and CHAD domain-containing protein [Prosthecomicrobium pneumaticum]|uniref:Inorganic triphosphatase YgiF n=1 Tax=Prosthecomicrobium pneumaticum TaxID=81895 RepID=A0A7W9CSZ8_9HYPH|nr:CYTH and CHAD domain-containing protein [Prosthecomicrobium pneumaticum]MBB5751358.1 inorganic triphosphatase YgiF [Prosthecomicrobium pneumaticum]
MNDLAFPGPRTEQGIAPPPIEVEIKLTGSAEAIAGAIRSPAIASRARNRGVFRRLEATYFDAPDHRLRRAGLTYRIRRSGGRLTATVKQELDIPEALAGRAEWEASVESAAPDPALLPQDAADAVRKALAGAPLFASVATRIRRHAIRLDVDGALLELAHDEGLIAAEGRSTTLHEIELELLAGGAEHLIGLARDLVETHGLCVGHMSKAERGFLLLGSGVPIVKAERPALDPAMKLDDAIATVLGAAARHVAGNLKAAEAGLQVEVIHQTRVSLRRLRSICGLMRRIAPAPVFRRLADEGKALAGALGRARDIDVFLAESLATAEPNDAARIDFAGLKAVAEAERRTAYEGARAALDGPSASRLHLALLDTLVRRSWREDLPPVEGARLNEAAAGAAADLLDRLAKQVRRRGRRLKTLPAPERHELRITVKKLNYAVDLLANLFEGSGKLRRYQNALAGLQQALGRANDSAVLPQLLDSLTTGAAPDLVRAAAYLEGWRARDDHDTEQDIRKAWRRFRSVEPFW